MVESGLKGEVAGSKEIGKLKESLRGGRLGNLVSGI